MYGLREKLQNLTSEIFFLGVSVMCQLKLLERSQHSQTCQFNELFPLNINKVIFAAAI